MSAVKKQKKTPAISIVKDGLTPLHNFAHTDQFGSIWITDPKNPTTVINVEPLFQLLSQHELDDKTLPSCEVADYMQVCLRDMWESTSGRSITFYENYLYLLEIITVFNRMALISMLRL